MVDDSPAASQRFFFSPRPAGRAPKQPLFAANRQCFRRATLAERFLRHDRVELVEVDLASR